MTTSIRPESRTHRTNARRHWMESLALLAVPLLLIGGSLVFTSPQPAVAVPFGQSLRESQFLSAFDTFRQARLQAFGQVAVARSVVASAQLALDTSAGKVLREEPRSVLREGIGLGNLRVTLATQELDQADQRSNFSRAVGSYFSDRPGFTEATATLQSIRFAWAASLDDLRANLATPVQAVKDAVVAWQAEQARLAAEAAARAAAEAARVAAAQAAQAAHATAVGRGTTWSPVAQGAARAPSAGAPPVSAALFNKYVWTSGWQAEIDACRGAVNLTAHYGVNTIAEHWSCGGSRFPRAGTTITLSGVMSGTYRVGGIVAVLNAATNGTSSIPRGYDLLYQTCINGSNARMSFTALTRIG